MTTDLIGFARARAVAQHGKPPACPANEKTCAYAPGKTMCCHSGHYCVPNVGCTCQGDDCGGVAAAGRRGRRAAGDFPFNKSYATHARIGPDGKHNWDTLYTNFTAGMFIGTNFDCHEPTFNYEAEAHAESWIDVFGESRQAFYAQFVYGADNGQQLANQVVVEAWGKQIYQKALPTVDCSPHTVPVAHSEPGFDHTFTIWTSFIPVTLHIKTQLTLDLSYTWSICDTDLSASIALNPKATLSVTGAAEVNLLIIDTSTELTSAFSQALVPTLALEGSKCKADLTLERKSDPMSVTFHSYYKYKKCKFLIFDCHWSDQYDHVWYQWNHPSEDVVEYTKTYNITL